jgi:Mg2+ and Co2+ transporter CorA
MAKAEAYRNSAAATMTEQSLVIRKFFASMVSRARNIMHRAHQAADAWLRTVMNPLVQQIQDHKRTMEQRLDTLRRISASRDNLDERILSLSAEQTRLRRDLALLDTLQSTLSRPLPQPEEQPEAGPVCVSEAG